MRKVSVIMPVLVAGVVFSFAASFLWAQADKMTEAGGQRPEVSAEKPAASAQTAPANQEQPGFAGALSPGRSALAEPGRPGVQATNAVQPEPPAVPKAALTNEEQPGLAQARERLPAPASVKNNNAPGVAEITVAAETGAAPESVETKADGGAAGASLITVAFDNVPVQDVVNMFAQISGANIIMAGSFSNMFITANLKNVEWKSALNLALGSVNLSMIEDASGILMVVTSEMYPRKLQEIEATKPLVTRTIVPRYLNAVDLVEQVKLFKVLSPRGSITTSQSAKQDVISLKSSQTKDALVIQNPSITTAMVITDIKEYVDKIEALVQTLDKREPQVFIEARIINVASGDSKKLGFDWGMLDSIGVQAGLQNVAWNYNDSHSVNNSKNNALNQYDRRSSQDDINKTYDINGQQYEDKKTEWITPPSPIPPYQETTIIPTRTIADKIGQGRDLTAGQSDSVLDTVMQTRTASAFLNFSQVSLFLSALEKNSNAEMISHPQLVVGNRVEAKIHVGQKYPVLPTISTTITGTTPTIQYSDGDTIILDLGLTLWVIPEIDFLHNTVRLTVRPETATQDGEVKNPSTGKTYPIVLSRDIVTRVNVPSGHTVAIGGLVENRKSKIEKKVPILGDIPLLGLLFRHTEDAVSKNNLIILITPTILDDNKPLTGMEAVAQLTIDKYEKMPLAAVKAVPSNTAASVTVGTNAVTPAAGMGRPAEGASQTPDAGRQPASNAPAATPGNAAAPPPVATPPAKP